MTREQKLVHDNGPVTDLISEVRKKGEVMVCVAGKYDVLYVKVNKQDFINQLQTIKNEQESGYYASRFMFTNGPSELHISRAY